MKKKVFIDGSAGTTGLRIVDRLKERNDIELVILTDEKRKDPLYRKEALNSCDVAFLCLPDDASREAVGMVENDKVTILDTSTAHRTADGWTYGFPELSAKHLDNISKSKRIAVPGCHASGFIALVFPLVTEGILRKDEFLSCYSITGYSGGGKKMIAQYEDEGRDNLLCSPRMYALSQNHKHLKEMSAITGLTKLPAFCPVVSDFYSGMNVSVALDGSKFSLDKIKKIYQNYYNGKIVKYVESCDEEGFVSAGKLSYKDCMEISVFGNDERFILNARYDNLGKGASGAAVECMNIALGLSPETGLDL